MLLSPKQREYVLKSAGHRWGFKGGATRSGKTYLDFRWIIPIRIRERIGKDGLAVILGVTKSTIERNVLEPMRNIYGDELVGTISSDNTAWIFGEKCYCLGAEKVSQVSKIRGASIKYCYGDEVADWSEEVFALLKSRLDKEYSCFDGTYNPQYPNHWLKRFLDSDADIFSQTYIRGIWVAAEGIVYKDFANDTAKYLIDDPIKWTEENGTKFSVISIGVDFGGTKSATKFQATGITRDFRVVALEEEYIKNEEIDPDALNRRFATFCQLITSKYGYSQTRADSAETVLIRGLDHTAQKLRLGTQVKNALKMQITDRIRLVVLLMKQGRLKVSRSCPHLIDAFQSAIYDPDKFEDERLDDGTSDIDSLDAFEYSIEPYYKDLERAGHMIGR